MEVIRKLKSFFIKETEISEKIELKTKNFLYLGMSLFVIFVTVVLIMPTELPIQFSEKMLDPDERKNQSSPQSNPSGNTASKLWGSPQYNRSSGSNQVNYNTSMLVGSGQGNAKTQLYPGQRLSARILDKFIVSTDPVPVLAELIRDSVSESGLTLSKGTKFYGEASFQKGSDKAQIRFYRLALVTGEIKNISGQALGLDGQPGIEGRVFSDGVKNTFGQIVTSFIGGMAQGSIETDALGRSRGGVENGILTAISTTAKDRAQSYGEKLKTEREWIEVKTNTEFDVVLSSSLDLQQGVNHE